MVQIKFICPFDENSLFTPLVIKGVKRQKFLTVNVICDSAASPATSKSIDLHLLGPKTARCVPKIGHFLKFHIFLSAGCVSSPNIAIFGL